MNLGNSKRKKFHAETHSHRGNWRSWFRISAPLHLCLRFAGPAALLLLLLLTTNAQPAAAQGSDRIRDRNGTTIGKVTKMSALAITITKGGVDTKKPVEEILSITFAGEPGRLASVRRAVKLGRFEKALGKLNQIDRAEVDRKEIAQEIDFLTTYCNVQRALAGQGKLAAAQKDVKGFLSKHSKSYHVPEAIELLGNVLLANKDYDGARAQYTKLGKAPAPYFKARSAILTGRVLQAEEKHQDAVAAFDVALQVAEGNTAAQSQVREATLHRAVSQSALGDVGPSTDTVKQIISQAAANVDDNGADDARLLAQAYIALGDCYLQANKKKEARQAFLHVDLLFNSATTEHAKALHELSDLWDELGQPTRARDAQDRLQEKYPGSRKDPQ